MLSVDGGEGSKLSGGADPLIYGARYIEPSEDYIHFASHDDLYYFEVYVGSHEVKIEVGDCAYWFTDDYSRAHLTRGEAVIKSPVCLTKIRGYMPENKSSDIQTQTCLPYINGCSSKQVFPPDRPGDPTLQMLSMPAFTEEQAHHIHATARVVLVVDGAGESVVGMKNRNATESLYPGKVIILEKMCPHHFRTEDMGLKVIPLHVWSSIESIEKNHPMFNGTHQV